MSPRKRTYNLGKRAAAVEATRRRIVDATRELHGEQGVAATSWDDIAARAGVGVGTVYRHFPSLEELVPACGEVTLTIVDLPDPAAAPALFDGVDGTHERLQRLAELAFGIYERGAPELQVVRREPHVHPAIAEFGQQFQASLEALVDAALDPLGVRDGDRRLVRALIDLSSWQALRDQGIAGDEAVHAVADLLAARIAPPGA
jgi:AcrR family transcriptional regulator